MLVFAVSWVTLSPDRLLEVPSRGAIQSVWVAMRSDVGIALVDDRVMQEEMLVPQVGGVVVWSCGRESR